MTNVIQGAMHQTRYMKSLEKITMDAQVSYQRLFIALGTGTVGIILWLMWGLGSGGKTKYIAIPATIMLISFLTLIINFMISSRTKSMLMTAGRLALAPYMERIRVKSKSLGNLKTVGIKQFKKGYIKFTNGDVGLMYKIDGQLSIATLPGTADAIANARAQYLVARTPDSQEQMIVSIKPMDTSSQLDNLQNYFNMETGDEMRDLWSKYMSLQIGNHIKNYISNEFTIAEAVIIREKDIPTLRKLKNIFEQSANSGLYANYKHVIDRDEFIDVLAPLTMLSKKGRIANGKTK